ncbi:Zn(2)-C6 fungal-type domain-containing protein [Mycena chlorophos]|uniref:Zn(2)-C6 fungal-type domain-containing protein n=1 Tax=Mycena chlorophos TaxID=658473 RepID=A0A8H6TRN7_MYCCL|nr:Zn(2)-C6 fungal-type domain-containing protein [Mycena chlorophos]
MSTSSTIPHVVVFLTRPLLRAGVVTSATSLTTAQIILNAALARAASHSGLLTLSPTNAPPVLLAACLGAGIEWRAWYAALTGGDVAVAVDEVTLVYGPGFVKARLGSARPFVDVWSADSLGLGLGSVVRISRQRQRKPTATVQTSLPGRIVIPSLDLSDVESDASSSPTVCSLSPVASPKGLQKPFALPVSRVRALPSSSPTVSKRGMQTPTSTPTPTAMTAYKYQGGVTRVMTGGVMLGPRARTTSTRRA